MAQESQDWFAVNFYNLLYIEYILYLNICHHLLFICLFVYLFIYLFAYCYNYDNNNRALGQIPKISTFRSI